MLQTMPPPALATHFRRVDSEAINTTRSGRMTSEEIHALLSLPFPAELQQRPNYRLPSDEFLGSSMSDRLVSPHQPIQYPRSEPWKDTAPTPDHQITNRRELPLPPALPSATNASSTASPVISFIIQDIGTTLDDRFHDLPKYTDFAATFTREEYTAIALCYDLYGTSSSKIVAAKDVFQTRRSAVLDLYWRFQTYDVLQYIKALQTPDQFDELSKTVSFHYCDINTTEDTRVIPIPIHHLSRLGQGDLAGTLLQANEESLFRRGQAGQGIRRWDQVHEMRFISRHGGASPLNYTASGASHLFAYNSVDNLLRHLEQIWAGETTTPRPKSPAPSSSSSGSETKSSHPSRASSVSSGVQEDSAWSGMELPFGFPQDPMASLLDISKTLASRTLLPAPARKGKLVKVRRRKGKARESIQNAPRKKLGAYFAFLRHIRGHPGGERHIFGEETTAAQSALAT